MNKPPLEILYEEVRKIDTEVSYKPGGELDRYYAGGAVFLVSYSRPRQQYVVTISQLETQTNFQSWDATLVAKLIAHPHVFI